MPYDAQVNTFKKECTKKSKMLQKKGGFRSCLLEVHVQILIPEGLTKKLLWAKELYQMDD